MKNLFLRQSLNEREQCAHQYQELKELGKYCQEDAITASKLMLATPLGLLGSFSAGAIQGWHADDPDKRHRKRKAIWRFARIWMQQALL
ncbi:MAG: hypothetical protein HWE26_04170 [Alteromonadaceae bacterium]|nr:hypothetical protein [Alteromonadaceae bacterium]